MFRLHFGKRAKVLTAALIMASTVAAVSGPASLASADSSLPSFLDASKLPICDKPGPQKPSSAPAKSVYDPTAPHCAMTPARAGFQLKGVDNNKFLRLDAARMDQLKRDNGITEPVVDMAPCGARCDNGILEGTTSGNRHGIDAQLQAQNVTLRADHQNVANWDGLQTLDVTPKLVQIGIIYNDWDGLCNVGTNKFYAPIIFTQAFTPTRQSIWCFSNYILGTGSFTQFDVTDNTGGWWNVWVNWNGQWQALLGWNVPNMTGGNAVGAVEAAEVIKQNGSTPDPFINTTRDQETQLNYGASDWRSWNVPTAQQTGGPYCFSSAIGGGHTSITAYDGC